MSEVFQLLIEHYVELEVDEIWPNGDAPENPTTADVVAAMEAYGDKYTVIRDWDLLMGDAEVSVNGREVWARRRAACPSAEEHKIIPQQQERSK